MADYANVIFSLSEPDQPRLLKSPIEGNLVTGVGIDIQASASETSDATILRIYAKGSNWGATAKALEIDASEGYAIPISAKTHGYTVLEIKTSGTSVLAGADSTNLLRISASVPAPIGGYIELYGPTASTTPSSIDITYGYNKAEGSGQRLRIRSYYGGWETLMYCDDHGRVGFFVTPPERKFHVGSVAKFDNLVAIRKDQGDYGGNFTNYTPPSGAVEGDMLFAVDTNATNPGQRLYAYLNGAWHYVDLT